MLAVILVAALAASPPPDRETVVRRRGGVTVTRNAYGMRYEITTRDPALIARLAAEDADANVRYAAVLALQDVALLEHLALNASDPAVRAQARARLAPPATPRVTPTDVAAAWRAAGIPGQEQGAIVRASRLDPSLDVRFTAVGHVADPHVLAEVAAFDASPQVRLAAVARLDDDALLSDLIRTSMVPEVRQAAIKRLRSPRAVLDAALRSPDAADRAAAAARLTRPADLVRIATEDRERRVRVAAVYALADPRALAEIARKAPHGDARTVAVGRIDDQAVLLEIAREDADPAAAGAAARKITTPRSLHALVESARAEAARSAAAYRLVEGADRETLARWATSHPAVEMRLIALGRVDDPAANARAARDGDPRVRRMAVWRVADDALLAELERGDPSAEVRQAAAERRRALASEARRRPISSASPVAPPGPARTGSGSCSPRRGSWPPSAGGRSR